MTWKRKIYIYIDTYISTLCVSLSSLRFYIRFFLRWRYVLLNWQCLKWRRGMTFVDLFYIIYWPTSVVRRVPTLGTLFPLFTPLGVEWRIPSKVSGLLFLIPWFVGILDSTSLFLMSDSSTPSTLNISFDGLYSPEVSPYLETSRCLLWETREPVHDKTNTRTTSRCLTPFLMTFRYPTCWRHRVFPDPNQYKGGHLTFLEFYGPFSLSQTSSHSGIITPI